MNLLIPILLFSFFATFAYAEDTAETENAYKKAQEVLKDKNQRQEIINKSDKAKKSDEFADQVVQGNDKQKEKLYQISADVLGNYSSDDPEKTNKALSEAAKDPATFLKSLTPEQKKAIEELAKSIESSKDNSKETPKNP